MAALNYYNIYINVQFAKVQKYKMPVEFEKEMQQHPYVCPQSCHQDPVSVVNDAPRCQQHIHLTCHELHKQNPSMMGVLMGNPSSCLCCVFPKDCLFGLQATACFDRPFYLQELTRSKYWDHCDGTIVIQNNPSTY